MSWLFTTLALSFTSKPEKTGLEGQQNPTTRKGAKGGGKMTRFADCHLCV